MSVLKGLSLIGGALYGCRITSGSWRSCISSSLYLCLLLGRSISGSSWAWEREPVI